MPQRKVFIPQIGEVLLAKRRGAKNLRLSINAKGDVRVSMPAWAPYSAGIAFAKSRADWIEKQLAVHVTDAIGAGTRIGRRHRVVFTQTFNGANTNVRINDNIISVTASVPIESPQVQEKLLAACEKALRAEATDILPKRISELAVAFGFSYKDVRIRKLVARWGSCSRDKTITLSYYLVQLPQELMDYVLLHELNHTKHLHHGPDFWTAFKQILPDARALQKQIRSHKPRVQPF